jgi:hypothetical protein
LSNRVIATASLNDTCRYELREQLRLTVDPVSELCRLNSIIVYHQLTRRDLQQLISTPGASSVLNALAPAEFSGVRAHLECGSRSALETTAADLQAELAETLAIAISVVTAAARDITANVFAESGVELGYTVTTHHAETAICVELCRGHEIVLVAVHDGGNVEFAHGGLIDGTSEEHQLQLERAANRHGVFVAQLS